MAQAHPSNDGLGSKRSARRLSAAIVKRDVLRLRLEGLTYEEIAERVGRSQTRVVQILDEVKEGIDDEVRRMRPIYRARELADIEEQSRYLKPLAFAGDFKAMELWMKAGEARRRITAVDLPPEKTQGDTGITVILSQDTLPQPPGDVIDAQVDELPPPALGAG